MMKKRRIIAAILILAFAFAFMAMNASAATPRGMVCDTCGSTNTYSYVQRISYTNETVPSCSSVTDYHTHTVYTCQKWIKCSACGDEFKYGSTYTETVCRG